MVIATVQADGDRSGCLVGFATQCSIDPVRYLVCLSTSNHTYRVATHATTMAVHVLHDTGHDRQLARLFGEATGDEVDKFELCGWSVGPEGVPVLDGCDWFAGEIHERVDLGDHAGFVLDVRHDGEAERTAEPYLAFPQVKDLDPGHDA
jgi:flavin reductase (DIM6/NTAB) family NADH-FMN oxidoreductase RutF